jgi:hypothetical protein
LSAAAQDVEREPLTFAWSVKSQPTSAGVALSSPGSAQTSASGLSIPGTYVFTVTIRDTAGHSVARDVTVRAYQGNQPPVIAEGHRIYKREWIVQPQSGSTFGPLFITAFDLEGDPVTTSFSVISQPSGANARFNGATVSGMTRTGDYTFRFTASDPTHTVTRDFVRTVVGSSPPPESGSTPPPGTGGRRRPPDTEPTGQAVPRQSGLDRLAGSSRPSAAAVRLSTPLTGNAAAGDSLVTGAAPLPFESLLIRLDRIDDQSVLPDTWRVLDVGDQNGDALIDVVIIELEGVGIFVVRLLRDRT